MSVYVDEPIHPFGRMMMCHMVADTPQELHAMADRIGVQRKWFQNKKDRPHYDICMSKRKLAVGFGAIETEDGRTIIEVAKRCWIESEAKDG